MTGPSNPEAVEWDLIVVGTGMCGGTLGFKLAEAGRSVLFLEKGKAYLGDPTALAGQYGELFFPGEVADHLRDITGFDGEIAWNTFRPDGQPRRCFDISKARRELGFATRFDIRSGLERTALWYRAPTRH